MLSCTRRSRSSRGTSHVAQAARVKAASFSRLQISSFVASPAWPAGPRALHRVQRVSETGLVQLLQAARVKAASLSRLQISSFVTSPSWPAGPSALHTAQGVSETRFVKLLQTSSVSSPRLPGLLGPKPCAGSSYERLQPCLPATLMDLVSEVRRVAQAHILPEPSLLNSSGCVDLKSTVKAGAWPAG